MARGTARGALSSTLGEITTDDDVFDLRGLDPSALYRATKHMCGERDAVSTVERTPRGSRDARTLVAAALG